MSAIAASALKTIGVFQSQELANPAWAFAKLAFTHQPLLNSIAAQAMAQSTECTPQEMANIAWAIANFG